MAVSPPTVSWAAANGRRLTRHGLRTPAAAGTEPAELARAVCGAHAQVLSAAEVSLALRIEGATRADVRRALFEDRSLVKTYGPRGTVHLLPTRDLPMWTGALSAVPAQSPFPEGVRLTPDQTDQVVGAIGAALADAELTVDELTEAVVDLAGPWAGERVMPAFQDLWPRWRQAVGTAAHRGVLCFGQNRGRRVTYTNPHRWLPGFAPAPEDEAVAELLRRYLHAYGPATSRQFAQWIGAPPAWAAERFRKHRRELTEVDFEGTPAWVAAGDAEVADDDAPVDVVLLLPYFDAFVVGSQPRDRLFPGKAAARALAPSGQAGNFPVLLVGGEVAGVWHQRRSGRRVEITVEPLAPLPAGRRRALEVQAGRIGETLEARPRLVVGTVTVGAHA
jgi:enamine deaminase RidA (YjgF/YER057c/UK114 family)